MKDYVNEDYGINIIGYLDTESGVGEAARGVIRNVKAAEIPHALINIEQPWMRREEKTYVQEFTKENPYRCNLLNINADQVPHVVKELGPAFFENKYNIGYWFWELSEFPDFWDISYSYLDEIWVASEFCLEAISKKAPIPVYKMPISINCNPQRKYGRSHFDIPESRYTFLFSFDCRSFIERKNPFGVVEAFAKSFKGCAPKDVLLVIKASNPEHNPTEFENLKQAADGYNIKILTGYLSKEENDDLLNLCDCYLALHRAEGLGLPLAEAMSLGKPVIATGYSGNMEFMNKGNSFLVDYSLVEIEKDLHPYKKGNVWAEPDTEHASELMYYVFQNPDQAKLVAEKGARTMNEMYSPGKLGEKMKSRLLDEFER